MARSMQCRTSTSHIRTSADRRMFDQAKITDFYQHVAIIPNEPAQQLLRQKVLNVKMRMERVLFSGHIEIYDEPLINSRDFHKSVQSMNIKYRKQSTVKLR
jgi:hypothetical protein